MNISKITDVIVIGAGASGLMAAIAASRRGHKVIICEQMKRPALKILATGGEKCNITNNLPIDEFAQKFGKQWRFMMPALNMMGNKKLQNFFHNLGVKTYSPDGFHIFPKSRKASDVVEALKNECSKNGVEIFQKTRVKELDIRDKQIFGIITEEGIIECKKVILATGGRSYASCGGTGGGYPLAGQAGHDIAPLIPGLVGLKTKEVWPSQCKGISLPNVILEVDLPKYKTIQNSGILLFTHHGISGPSVIDISAQIGELLLKFPEVPLKVNLFPDFHRENWEEKFKKHKSSKQVHKILEEYFPKTLAHYLCEISEGIKGQSLAQLSKFQKTKLLENLTQLKLTIIQSIGFGRAMVTKGGVKLKKVSPDTLESKLVSGLYFCGEVLNLDGPCGGYNLQWAFASGWLAGNSV